MIMPLGTKPTHLVCGKESFVTKIQFYFNSYHLSFVLFSQLTNNKATTVQHLLQAHQLYQVT